MGDLAALVASPEAWIALATLIVMEVVLGVDNLVFVSILSNKLPEARRAAARRLGIGLALDVVFSIDSILTAVGMTEHLPIMMAAVIVAVGLMLVAAGPLARFIHDNPTVVMLALGFLLMIGATLIADAFGIHVPKGYIYAAMAFSGLVEGLNMASRRKRKAGRSPPSDDRTLH